MLSEVPKPVATLPSPLSATSPPPQSIDSIESASLTTPTSRLGMVAGGAGCGGQTTSAPPGSCLIVAGGADNVDEPTLAVEKELSPLPLSSLAVENEPSTRSPPGHAVVLSPPTLLLPLLEPESEDPVQLPRRGSAAAGSGGSDCGRGGSRGRRQRPLPVRGGGMPPAASASGGSSALESEERATAVVADAGSGSSGGNPLATAVGGGNGGSGGRPDVAGGGRLPPPNGGGGGPRELRSLALSSPLSSETRWKNDVVPVPSLQPLVTADVPLRPADGPLPPLEAVVKVSPLLVVVPLPVLSPADPLLLVVAVESSRVDGAVSDDSADHRSGTGAEKRTRRSALDGSRTGSPPPPPTAADDEDEDDTRASSSHHSRFSYGSKSEPSALADKPLPRLSEPLWRSTKDVQPELPSLHLPPLWKREPLWRLMANSAASAQTAPPKTPPTMAPTSVEIDGPPPPLRPPLWSMGAAARPSPTFGAVCTSTSTGTGSSRRTSLFSSPESTYVRSDVRTAAASDASSVAAYVTSKTRVVSLLSPVSAAAKITHVPLSPGRWFDHLFKTFWTRRVASPRTLSRALSVGAMSVGTLKW